MGVQPYTPPGYNQPPIQQIQLQQNPQTYMNQPMYPQNTHVIVMGGNGGLPDPNFPLKKIPEIMPFPQPITCVYCNNNGMTIVTREVSTSGCIFICLLLCIFWPLFWVPLMCNSSYRHIHTCQTCMNVVSYEI